MKKISIYKTKSILAGGTHYHWFCNVNNFRSAKYTNRNACYDQATAHGNYYGHNKNVTVINCTGNC